MSCMVLNVEDGLLYGYGIFETILIKDGDAIYLREHYERMLKGSKKLKINIDISLEKFKLYIENYIKKEDLKSSILRVTILKNKDYFDLIITHRKNNYKKSNYEKGFKLEISKFKRNFYSILSNVKSVNYLENIYALREAKENKNDEVLFLDTNNKISEGATSNIFFIKGGVIYTPTKECGLLEGIIRDKLIEIIKKNRKLKLKKGEFILKELLDAEEVFLTNSIMEIMPVSKIDYKIYDLKKNYITQLLIEEFKKN